MLRTVKEVAVRSRQVRGLATGAPARPVKFRFAPSPTGYLHLGGLRTALFNYLLARQWKGKFVLRIEDTDQTRLVPGAVDALRSTLEWAGLDYDEGPGVGGSSGPYIQSERLELYKEAAQKLQDHDHAYACFCTLDKLTTIRLDLQKRGRRVAYDGRCRHLTQEDVARRKKAGETHVIRFKGSTVVPHLPPDLIYGDAHNTAPIDDADDFILLKSDGFPTYHLANVVDDAAMEISHVMRGEEWLPSTVRHHLLYNALGLQAPEFGHLPLLVNADGSKLSKRTGDVRVQHYISQGYEPEALLNFLGLMGWDHHGATPDLEASDVLAREVFTLKDLVERFDISAINHKRAAVDLNKLDFLNKMHLRRIAQSENRETLVKRYQEQLRRSEVLRNCELVEDLSYVSHVFDAELARTVKLNDMALSSIFFYLDPKYDCHESTNMIAHIHKSAYVKSISAVLDKLEDLPENFTEDDIWDVMNETLASLGLRKKAELILPMRHALTGRKAGPSVPATMRVLGLSRSLQRLQAALNFIQA